MQKQTGDKPALQVRSSVEGLEVAPGTFRTATGTICVPLSRQREEAKQKAVAQGLIVEDKPEQKEKAPSAVQQAKHIPAKTVQFITPIGTMEALYFPVIDLPDWVVLGRTANSFVPKSYREDPNLKFQIKSDDLKPCSVVYTGCQFTDPATRATYIVFMKV